MDTKLAKCSWTQSEVTILCSRTGACECARSSSVLIAAKAGKCKLPKEAWVASVISFTRFLYFSRALLSRNSLVFGWQPYLWGSLLPCRTKRGNNSLRDAQQARLIMSSALRFEKQGRCMVILAGLLSATPTGGFSAWFG